MTSAARRRALTARLRAPFRRPAIDATDGSVAWQKIWPDACYSGTVTTKGNLVFVGRNNGELQAYDARNGNQLWSFQTGAGANDTVSVFEQDGKQYVAFLSAGNSLMASAHGDSLWLFSLDGTMGRRPPRARAPARSTPARAAAKAAGNRGQRTLRRGRPCSPTTARAATALTGRAGTAVRT